MILILCLLSDVALYLYKIFMKISKRVPELLKFFHFQDFQRGIIL